MCCCSAPIAAARLIRAPAALAGPLAACIIFAGEVMQQLLMPESVLGCSTNRAGHSGRGGSGSGSHPLAGGRQPECGDDNNDDDDYNLIEEQQ